MCPHNLLCIENSVGLGGSTISLSDLVCNLDRTIYTPFIVFSRPEQQEYFRHRSDDSIDTMVIQCGGSLKFTAPAQKVLSLAEKWSPRFKKLIFSVLSIFDLLFVIIPYVLRLYLFVRRKDIALIHHNNGFDPGSILLARILGLPLVAYQRGEEWNSPMVRYLSRFVGVYIANSKATRASLVSIGVDPRKIVVIHPAVDFARFDYRVSAVARRREFNIGDSELCFGVFGLLYESKGHRVFLKAARAVFGAVLHAKAFIIGDVLGGDMTYKQELLALVDELGIRDRVVFTGFRVDIPELIQMLHVIVFPSIAPEGFGRVIVEAMAMKKPVVATTVGGPNEIIKDCHNGFLVPPSDDRKLAGSIIQLLTDHELANRIGNQAYLDATAKFSISLQVRMTQEAYALLLKRKVL